MTTLPRGRHGLDREQVVAHQRERILRAMADAMAERGYAGTPVAEVIRRAGVSRETFYQQFGSKQDCFLAAYAWAADQLRAGLTDGLAVSGTPLERIAGVLASYLDAVAEDPVRSRLFLVESYAAGTEVMRRRLEIQAEAATALADLVGADTPDARFAGEALLAAIVQMVTVRVVLADADALRALHAPLVALASTLFPEREE